LKIDVDSIEILQNIMQCEKDGINWIARAAASKFREIDPSLGTKLKKFMILQITNHLNLATL
jgi:hypothetical protein